jgi:acetyl esterase/lipase
LLWIHGGGYIMGNLVIDNYSLKRMCEATNCVIVAVDYRLAPENPYPDGLEDCYAALKWTARSGDQLHIDKTKIAIGGGSAGGGLAAALALLARDRNEIKIAFQLLVYPMLDCRNITPSSYAIEDPRTWNREKNLFAWDAYLGKLAGKDVIPPYASPSLAKDLSGLPPAYVSVGDLDLFLDETIDYAQRLLQAGVPTEFHIYPGAIHGFDGNEETTIAKRAIAEKKHAIMKALF